MDTLVSIFGENLLDKEALDYDFRSLIGIEKNKPFECVGTRKETLACLYRFMQNHSSILTDRYRDFIYANKYELDEVLNEFCDDNLIPDEILQILKENL